MRLVLATANPDKVAEISALLTGVELAPRPPGLPEVDESGQTLEENARLKARAVGEATGEPAVADDTGLEVAALSGAPGVRSSRYAGEDASYGDNVAKLLGALEGVSERRARFRTVALVSFPDGREVLAEGTVEGAITDEPRGEQGFGYDPVFAPDGGGGHTFGEMTLEQKGTLSHRARAFRKMAALLTSP